jgi:uncharacterized membrane protein
MQQEPYITDVRHFEVAIPFWLIALLSIILAAGIAWLVARRRRPPG